MAELTKSKKKAEPKSDFGPREERKYPMPDAAHAGTPKPAHRRPNTREN
ncbi:hypothetical protein HDF16_004913 [Granulicella aggregans]|uniref:Uncharacterized protein n=1 Tax=Granulicella aggregans TaxID=474949 RepID=A0A7W7ZHX8_9BACT|nr:hypothetical protein [Granulicella aggregans]MBB5060177.1 hypothetical protein [Granulicella aggregans]